MSGTCRAGVELPWDGPCPVCGATEDDECRGRAYAEIMKRARQPIPQELPKHIEKADKRLKP